VSPRKAPKIPKQPEAVDQNHEIVQADVTLTPTGYKYSDAAAVTIAMRDMDTWFAFIQASNWAARWTDADTLVQSPQSMSPWGQGIGMKACVPNFLLSNALDVVVPKIVGGLTYEDPPFLLRPRPGTTDEVIRAKTAIFSYQLEDMNFVETVEMGVYDCGLRGTVIFKWGWHEETRRFRTFKRKADPIRGTTPTGFNYTIHTDDSDAIEFEYVERQVRRPYLEKKDLARVGFDPACKDPDCRKAKWSVEWGYVDWEDLMRIAQLPDYDVPKQSVLMDWFMRDKKPARPDSPVMTMPEGMRAQLVHALPENFNTSADPLRAKMVLVERQDSNSIVVVLCHGSDCILIRNSENPFAEIARGAGGTGHTYLSSVWRPLRDSLIGQGLGQIVGTRQMVAQGTENLALEVAAYPLHPTFTMIEGWNTPTQNISLGSGDVLKIQGDDVRKGIGLLEMPKVPSEVWQILQYNKAESLESAGTNQQVTMGAGAAGVQTTGMRSGSGAQAVTAAAAGRLDGPTERIIRQVFVPWLYIMDNLNNELLPTQQIREILSEGEIQSLDLDHVAFRNAQMKYEVLAGAHLGPKREMAQFLAAIEQIAINPALLEAAAEADMQFNFRDWFKSYAEIAGFKFTQQFFTDMTAAQKKRRDQNSKAGIMAQQSQAKQQQFQQTQQAKTQNIFDNALARAGEKATVLQVEHSLQIGQEQLGSETVG
jgi:hypothetical protein